MDLDLLFTCRTARYDLGRGWSSLDASRVSSRSYPHDSDGSPLPDDEQWSAPSDRCGHPAAGV